MVLLVLCATIVRLADALHEAPLLDRMLVQRVEVGRKQAEDLCIRKCSLDTDKASIGGLSGGVMSTTVGLGASEFAILGPPQVCPTQMPSADAKSALNHRKVALQGLCLYDLDPGKSYCVMVMACLQRRRLYGGGPCLRDGSGLFWETSSQVA